MKRALLAAVSLAALNLSATQSQAADVLEPAPDETTFYVSLFGGASFLEDIDTNYDNDGTDYTVETEIGYIVGGAIGVRIWDPLRTEVEVSYSRWEGDEYSNDLGDEGSVDGHIDAVYLLGNVWFDFGNDWVFRPYIGGGAGVAWADADTTFDDNDFGYGDGEAGFAFQLGAGGAFDLSENIALDIGYRFKGILDVDFEDSDGGGTYEDADLFSHNIQLGLTFRF